ncbi:MAG: SPOR domain-containing protein [Nitrospinales bacterium]
MTFQTTGPPKNRRTGEKEVVTVSEATLHLKLFSVVTALALTVALVYYSGGYDSSLLDSLLPGQTENHGAPPPKPKRIIKKYAKKQQPVSSPPEELTFFDTLADPALKKYVGLDGKIKGRQLYPKNAVSTGAQKPDRNPPPPKTALPKHTPNVSPTVISPSRKVTASLDAVDVSRDNANYKFAVQANSFETFDQAIDLVKKLQLQGYPAYLSAFEPSERSGIWYRVFLGRFADRGKALQTARKARTEEGLTPKVIMDKE